jgi:hypothetical protein
MTYKTVRIAYTAFIAAGAALLGGLLVCVKVVGSPDMVTKRLLVSGSLVLFAFAMFINAWGGTKFGKIIGRGGVEERGEVTTGGFNGLLCIVIGLGVILLVLAAKTIDGSTPIRF